MTATQRLRLAAAALCLGGGCSAPAPDAPTDHWRYTIALHERGDVLEARLRLPAGSTLQLTVASPAVPFVTDVTANVDGHEHSLQPVAGAFAVPAGAAPREVRWRFLARRASLRIDDIELAAWRGGAFMGSLGAFLLFPTQVDGDDERAFVLQVDRGSLAFAAPSPDPGGSGWINELRNLPMLPPCTFGPVQQHLLQFAWPAAETTDDSVHIDVVDLAGRSDASRRAVDGWVREAADAVQGYFGRFPVPYLLLILAPGRGHTIHGGSARGLGGSRILLDVPRDADADDLRRDWVLFHEMVHLNLPSLAPRHHWLEEGSAVYLEPQLQARAGRLPEQEVWNAILSEYEQGLPTADAGGLDDDPSWGRTYYGGAIFCLTADVEIRRRTDNTKSLQDALRAVVAAGGNITVSWPIEDVLRVGDEATGTNVLGELYAARRHAAEPRELEPLWRQLGVRLEGDQAVFDDTAPLAAVRRSLVTGR